MERCSAASNKFAWSFIARRGNWLSAYFAAVHHRLLLKHRISCAKCRISTSELRELFQCNSWVFRAVLFFFLLPFVSLLPSGYGIHCNAMARNSIAHMFSHCSTLWSRTVQFKPVALRPCCVLCCLEVLAILRYIGIALAGENTFLHIQPKDLYSFCWIRGTRSGHGNLYSLISSF